MVKYTNALPKEYVCFQYKNKNGMWKTVWFTTKPIVEADVDFEALVDKFISSDVRLVILDSYERLVSVYRVRQKMMGENQNESK